MSKFRNIYQAIIRKILVISLHSRIKLIRAEFKNRFDWIDFDEYIKVTGSDDGGIIALMIMMQQKEIIFCYPKEIARKIAIIEDQMIKDVRRQYGDVVFKRFEVVTEFQMYLQHPSVEFVRENKLSIKFL